MALGAECGLGAQLQVFSMLTFAKLLWEVDRPSRRMGNFTSQEPTMFCKAARLQI